MTDAPTTPPTAYDLLAGANLDPQTLAILKFAMGQQGNVSSASDEAESSLERIATLERTNRDLLRMLDKLAGALGSCRDCWGANPGCTTCGGDGHPGFHLPDRQAFEAFVMPVVHAMASRTVSRQRRPTTSCGTWAPSLAIPRHEKEN